jgi:hypothetical protein
LFQAEAAIKVILSLSLGAFRPHISQVQHSALLLILAGHGETIPDLREDGTKDPAGPSA